VKNGKRCTCSSWDTCRSGISAKRFDAPCGLCRWFPTIAELLEHAEKSIREERDAKSSRVETANQEARFSLDELYRELDIAHAKLANADTDFPLAAGAAPEMVLGPKTAIFIGPDGTPVSRTVGEWICRCPFHNQPNGGLFAMCIARILDAKAGIEPRPARQAGQMLSKIMKGGVA
jgi:hypothetical protein